MLEPMPRLKSYLGEPSIEEDVLDIQEGRLNFVKSRMDQLSKKDYTDIEFCKIGGEKKGMAKNDVA